MVKITYFYANNCYSCCLMQICEAKTVIAKFIFFYTMNNPPQKAHGQYRKSEGADSTCFICLISVSLDCEL